MLVSPSLQSITREVVLLFGGGAFTISDPIRTAVHEFLHSSNVYHHGKGDKDLQWVVQEVNGKLAFQEGGTLVLLYDEDKSLVDPVEAGSTAVSLGVEGGQHSGDANCVMCYKAAEVYKAKGACVAGDGSPCKKYYWVSGYEDAPRRSLCDAAAETLYNVSGHSPQSRFFGASAGCCQHQICVNDKMGHGGPRRRSPQRLPEERRCR